MTLNVSQELAAMERATVNELRKQYAEVFGEPARTRNKQWLIKRIIWRLQSLEEGDLSERARRRAEELANDADLRVIPPRQPDAAKTVLKPMRPNARLPMPDTMITRKYKGRKLQVQVLPNGFEYEGQIYRSLSAVAKAITGSHWNGYHFFGVKANGGAI